MLAGQKYEAGSPPARLHTLSAGSSAMMLRAPCRARSFAQSQCGPVQLAALCALPHRLGSLFVVSGRAHFHTSPREFEQQASEALLRIAPQCFVFLNSLVAPVWPSIVTQGPGATEPTTTSLTQHAQQLTTSSRQRSGFRFLVL